MIACCQSLFSQGTEQHGGIHQNCTQDCWIISQNTSQTWISAIHDCERQGPVNGMDFEKQHFAKTGMWSDQQEAPSIAHQQNLNLHIASADLLLWTSAQNILCCLRPFTQNTDARLVHLLDVCFHWACVRGWTARLKKMAGVLCSCMFGANHQDWSFAMHFDTVAVACITLCSTFFPWFKIFKNTIFINFSLCNNTCKNSHKFVVHLWKAFNANCTIFWRSVKLRFVFKSSICKSRILNLPLPFAAVPQQTSSAVCQWVIVQRSNGILAFQCIGTSAETWNLKPETWNNSRPTYITVFDLNHTFFGGHIVAEAIIICDVS